jgi:FkbM family methyltransferase
MEKTHTTYLEYVGSSKWWLKVVKGARLSDKLVMGFLKTVYFGWRVALRIILGRKRRDKFLVENKINWKDFLYSSAKVLRVDKSLLLEISVPHHNYRIHCPLNKEDLIVMTKHEEEIIELFHPKEGDVVVDIGAHMGRYTITSSKHVGRRGKVVAVEAHPYNFELLEGNLRLNRLTNVRTVNCALYSKKDKLKLYLPDEEQGYTMHHSLMTNYLVSKYDDRIEQKYIEVEADTLDNLMHRIGIKQVNWIKIDVEGAEYEVLSGAREILSNSDHLSLLIEIHGKDTYVPTMELLRSNHFNVEFERTYDNGEKHVLASKSLS